MLLYYSSYYYGFYFDDPLFVLSMVLIIAALIITAVAQAKVKSSFAKYSQMPANLTGAAAAERLLAANGVYNVTITRTSGHLSDHFDPKTNTIRLSEAVYDCATVAAVGVACHEAGHALEYAKGYAPIKLRNAIIPVTRIGSSLAMPLIFLGFLFAPVLAEIGVAFYALSTVFQLITLPVEFNASSRAVAILGDSGMVTTEELPKVKKVLKAAAYTYLAAAASSALQLLRLLLIARRRRD